MRPRRWGARGARYKRPDVGERRGGEGRRREENCVCRLSDYQKTLSVRRREKFRREQQMHGLGKGNPSANDTRQLNHKGIWMPPVIAMSRTRFDRVRCELCNPLTGNRRTTSYERAINYRNTRKKPRREFKTVRVKSHISKEFSIVRIEKKLRKYLEGIDTCNPLFFERKLSEL